jgi:hypothetical protein
LSTEQADHPNKPSIEREIRAMMPSSGQSAQSANTKKQAVMHPEPVFLDKTGRRWRVVKCLLIIFALGFVSLPTAFLISALTVQPAVDEATITGARAMPAGQASQPILQVDHGNSRHRQH